MYCLFVFCVVFVDFCDCGGCLVVVCCCCVKCLLLFSDDVYVWRFLLCSLFSLF